MLDTGA